MEVAEVSIKIPSFWPADSEVRFAQIDAQFYKHGITVPKIKFDHILASLAPEFATEIRNLFISPSSDDAYDVLKAILTKRTTASQQCKLQQLLNAEELDD